MSERCYLEITIKNILQEGLSCEDWKDFKEELISEAGFHRGRSTNIISIRSSWKMILKRLPAGVLTMSGCRLITRMLRQKKAMTSKRDTGISKTVFRGAVNTI